MLVEKRPPNPEPKPVAAADLSLADKVAFLMRGDAYRPPVPEVTRHETHMSQVFLAGDRVYKLKKPVRFPYLDFSTLARREAACRAELKLNRRLAPDVYRDVVPLVRSAHGLAIGGAGEVVDWLVVMNRLDETQMLDRVIIEGVCIAGSSTAWRPFLCSSIAAPAPRSSRPPCMLRSCGAASPIIAVFFSTRAFNLPSGSVWYIDAMQRRFLTERAELLAERVRTRRIVDGHGDLRPEHICLGDPVRIIDCLEFNRAPAHGRSVRRNRVPVRRMRAAGRRLGRRIFAAPHHARAARRRLRGAFYLLSLPSCHAAGAPRHRAPVRARSTHAGEMGAACAHLSAACGGGCGAARKKPQSMIRKWKPVFPKRSSSTKRPGDR